MEDEIVEPTENVEEIKDVSENSILDDIKKLVNISKEDTSFDTDIIIHINSSFMVLNQLGVGPEAGFRISDSSTKWIDYLNIEDDLEAVKTYIYQKVKLVFDPPLSTTVMDALKESIKEAEWRLNVKAESKGG